MEQISRQCPHLRTMCFLLIKRLDVCSKGHNADYVKKGNSEISLLIALVSFSRIVAKVGILINNLQRSATKLAHSVDQKSLYF